MTMEDTLVVVCSECKMKNDVFLLGKQREKNKCMYCNKSLKRKITRMN